MQDKGSVLSQPSCITMGVKDLWKVLEPVRTPCSLSDLSGKTLAVDLSGWIVESESVATAGLQRIAKPHVK